LTLGGAGGHRREHGRRAFSGSREVRRIHLNTVVLGTLDERDFVIRG